jgi:hypothetical protein
MRLSSGRRAPPCALLPERGGRAPSDFSGGQITASTVRTRAALTSDLSLVIVSGIVKLHGFQLTIATRSRLLG